MTTKRGILSVIGVLTASLALIPGSSVVQAAPGDIELIDHGLGGPDGAQMGSASDDLRYIVVSDFAGTSYHRVDTTNGRSVPLPEGHTTIDSSGDHAFTVLNFRTLRRTNIRSGAVLDVTPPWQQRDRLMGNWGSFDATDRYVVFSTYEEGGPGGSNWLMDLQTGKLLTPEPLGLTTMDQAKGGRISRDARYVTWFEHCCVGANASRVIRWDRRTGERFTLSLPTGHDPFSGQWAWSESMRFVALKPTKSQYVIRDVLTGAESTLPFDATNLRSVTVTNSGRVIFAQDPTNTGSAQLYAWDGPGTDVQRITTARDGGPANFNLWRFMVSDDGNVVVFESTATNLVSGTSSPKRRQYRIELAPLPTASPILPTALVQPGETVCASAPGAAVGDVVGVNIVPVLAVGAGDGALHSSNGFARGTANVNFNIGTVDPNVAFATVGPNGRVCYTNSKHSSVHIILDELIVGDGATFSNPTSTGAKRIMDTRKNIGGSRIGPSQKRCVATVGTSPGDVVGVNIVPVGAAGAGDGSLHSSDVRAGGTANVNFGPNTIDPNLAFTAVGTDGKICYTNSKHTSVDIILDELIVGDGNAFSNPTPSGAKRIMDTRKNIGGGRIAPSEERCVATVGASAGDVVGVNIVPVGAAGAGDGSLHSSNVNAAGTANVNFTVGSVDPNLAFATVGTDGKICYTNSKHTSVDIILDELIVGDGSAFSNPTPQGAKRIMDTRKGIR